MLLQARGACAAVIYNVNTCAVPPNTKHVVPHKHEVPHKHVVPQKHVVPHKHACREERSVSQ